MLMDYSVYLQDLSVSVGNDTIMDALKVLVGIQSIPLFSFKYYLLFIIYYSYSLQFFRVSDVRNHPVLIHCNRGKVFII